MGGFLNPPTHPTHTHCVEEVARGEVVGMSSLESDLDWVPDQIKQKAKKILQEWEDNKPPLDGAWALQVLGYFRNCYIPPSGNTAASTLTIDPERNPMDHIDSHAGVAYIRKYYPDFTPRQEDFNRAKWGS
jgi:hypothetical protein